MAKANKAAPAKKPAHVKKPTPLHEFKEKVGGDVQLSEVEMPEVGAIVRYSNDRNTWSPAKVLLAHYGLRLDLHVDPEQGQPFAASAIKHESVAEKTEQCWAWE